MTHRGRAIWIAIGLTATLGIGARAQAPPGGAKPAPAKAEPAVATVGGARITRAAFEQRVREAEQSYRERANAQVPAELRPLLRRQVLEGLIREQLLTLEARRRGLALSPEQAEEELKRDPFFQRDGLFDEAKYLAVRTTQPDQFRRALEQIRTTLPPLRLKEQIERENQPDRKRLEREVERKLSQVRLDFLALRRAAFPGDAPEPSEREILAYYREHPDEFQRPEQVVATLVNVNQPPLSAADRASATAVQSWEARMRERADSLIAAIRGGARLEDLAPSFGELRTGVAIERERFPQDWRGNARARQALFTTAPGRVLDEPVSGEPGFIVTRVDQRLPARTARLAEVAGTIRLQLRARLAQARDDRELRALYDSVRDSLRGTAYQIRYAVADTALVRVAEPSVAELDRYYRGHLADYSFYDSKTSSVGARPLSEVRAEVRARLLHERRTAAARTAAEQLLAAWRAGRRDAKLERAMAWVREVGPVATGGVVDTGVVGRVLTDTLASRRGLQVDWAPTPSGWVVFHRFAEVKGFTPSFEQARSLLASRLAPRRLQEEEQGARRYFDEHPDRFTADRVIRFSRLMVNPPEVTVIPLTRAEVERYYQSKLDEYGAPELVRVRHILVTPRDATPQADAEARREAEDLLRQVRAGGNFAELARQYSDDEASRGQGGDLGVFRRGMMLQDFEEIAFAMRRGDLRGPVKTEVGYHVMECLEYVPAEMTPLKYAYGTIAGDLARVKSERVAEQRADSLRRALKTPAQARRAANRMGFSIFQNDHVVGKSVGVAYLGNYFKRLETLKPGQFDTGIQEYKGMGYAVSWVDSILPPQPPSWDLARDDARSAYRLELQRRAVERKRAELDSMLQAGWSFDSLATLFGGLERHGPLGPGSGLERLAGRDLLDSLAFGTATAAPVLEPGRVTGWIEFPAGLVKLRLVERRGPEAVQRASRFESESRAALERNLRATYDRLKGRFPVEILDQELRYTELPPIPDS